MNKMVDDFGLHSYIPDDLQMGPTEGELPFDFIE